MGDSPIPVIISTTSTDDAPATSGFENVDFGRYEVEGDVGAPDAIVIHNDGTAEIHATSFMSAEQFYQNFEGCFQIAGHVTGNDGFPIKPPEAQNARTTSDLIYEQCKKVSWLNWVIAEEGSDAAKYLAVAMFGFGKYQAVRAGFIAKARAESEAREKADNDS